MAALDAPVGASDVAATNSTPVLDEDRFKMAILTLPHLNATEEELEVDLKLGESGVTSLVGAETNLTCDYATRNEVEQRLCKLEGDDVALISSLPHITLKERLDLPEPEAQFDPLAEPDCLTNAPAVQPEPTITRARTRRQLADAVNRDEDSTETTKNVATVKKAKESVLKSVTMTLSGPFSSQEAADEDASLVDILKSSDDDNDVIAETQAEKPTKTLERKSPRKMSKREDVSTGSDIEDLFDDTEELVPKSPIRKSPRKKNIKSRDADNDDNNNKNKNDVTLNLDELFDISPKTIMKNSPRRSTRRSVRLIGTVEEIDDVVEKATEKNDNVPSSVDPTQRRRKKERTVEEIDDVTTEKAATEEVEMQEVAEVEDGSSGEDESSKVDGIDDVGIDNLDDEEDEAFLTPTAGRTPSPKNMSTLKEVVGVTVNQEVSESEVEMEGDSEPEKVEKEVVEHVQDNEEGLESAIDADTSLVGMISQMKRASQQKKKKTGGENDGTDLVVETVVTETQMEKLDETGTQESSQGMDSAEEIKDRGTKIRREIEEAASEPSSQHTSQPRESVLDDAVTMEESNLKTKVRKSEGQDPKEVDLGSTVSEPGERTEDSREMNEPGESVTDDTAKSDEMQPKKKKNRDKNRKKKRLSPDVSMDDLDSTVPKTRETTEVPNESEKSVPADIAKSDQTKPKKKKNRDKNRKSKNHALNETDSETKDNSQGDDSHVAVAKNVTNETKSIVSILTENSAAVEKWKKKRKKKRLGEDQPLSISTEDPKTMVATESLSVPPVAMESKNELKKKKRKREKSISEAAIPGPENLIANLKSEVVSSQSSEPPKKKRKKRKKDKVTTENGVPSSVKQNHMIMDVNESSAQSQGKPTDVDSTANLNIGKKRKKKHDLIALNWGQASGEEETVTKKSLETTIIELSNELSNISDEAVGKKAKKRKKDKFKGEVAATSSPETFVDVAAAPMEAALKKKKNRPKNRKELRANSLSSSPSSLTSVEVHEGEVAATFVHLAAPPMEAATKKKNRPKKRKERRANSLSSSPSSQTSVEVPEGEVAATFVDLAAPSMEAPTKKKNRPKKRKERRANSLSSSPTSQSSLSAAMEVSMVNPAVDAFIEDLSDEFKKTKKKKKKDRQKVNSEEAVRMDIKALAKSIKGRKLPNSSPSPPRFGIEALFDWGDVFRNVKNVVGSV